MLMLMTYNYKNMARHNGDKEEIRSRLSATPRIPSEEHERCLIVKDLAVRDLWPGF